MEKLQRLKGLERLAMRKASVYSRVLTDISLANEMQSLAEFHAGRMESLAQLLGEEVAKESGSEDEA